MAQIGNKINSWLNGEWAKHGRPFGKRQAASVRRMLGKEEIRQETALTEDGDKQEEYKMLDVITDVIGWIDYAWEHDEKASRYLDESPKRLYQLEELCKNKKQTWQMHI